MSVADSLSIGGYNNLLNDSAWQNYWAMSQQLGSASKTQAELQNPMLSSQSILQANNDTINTSFGSLPAGVQIARATETTNSSNGLLPGLVTVVTVGTGLGWWMISRGKSAGAEGLWNRFKAGIRSFWKKSEDITAIMVNGKPVYKIPGQTQTLRGANIKAQKDSLGLTVNEGLEWTNPASRIKGYHINITHNGVNNRITVRNGKVVNCTNLDKNHNAEGRNFTEAYNNRTLDCDFMQKINKAISAVNKKDMASIPSEAQIQNIAYGYEVAPGTQALYIAQPSEKPGDAGIKLLKTNRFTHDSDVVWQLKDKNSTFKAISAMIEDKKPKLTNLKIAQATYNPSSATNSTGWPKDAVMNVANGKVVSITEGANVYKPGDMRYDALHARFGNLFEDALKNPKNLIDPEYALCA